MLTPGLSFSPAVLPQPVAPVVSKTESSGAASAFAKQLNSTPQVELDVEQRIGEIRTRHTGVLNLSSFSAELVELARDLARGRVDPTPAEMFLLQAELSQVQFGLEIATKVVEHATSGAKTALQTQM